MDKIRNKNLSDDEVIVRYVGGAHIDPKTKKINGSAFERSAKDTDGVSFNRRRIFCYGEICDRKKIINIMKTRMKLGKTSCFAEVLVKDALEKLSTVEGISIIFLEDPLDGDNTKPCNPAHAIMEGFPFVGETIGSLSSELAGDLLRKCIIQEYPAFS